MDQEGKSGFRIGLSLKLNKQLTQIKTDEMNPSRANFMWLLKTN
jgi:hypothetical protein